LELPSGRCFAVLLGHFVSLSSPKCYLRILGSQVGVLPTSSAPVRTLFPFESGSALQRSIKSS
jgi:hypothetical protein